MDICGYFRVSDVNIATDVICGFPTETEKVMCKINYNININNHVIT